MEYRAKWNGLTRGDNVSVDGTTAKFIHAAFLDGEVQYVMVVSNRQWRMVDAKSVSKSASRRKNV